MKTSLKKVLVGVVALVLILTSTMTSTYARLALLEKCLYVGRKTVKSFQQRRKTYIVREITSPSQENPEKSQVGFLHYLNKGDVLISETLIENAKHNL